MKDLSGLIEQVGTLLARVEKGIADTEGAVGDALIERADEIERIRTEDMERQRKMIDAESDPHKLRGIEALYVAAATDRQRARRIGRYERDLKLQREEREAERGEPLIMAP